ncbi:hypothetical protein SETIT_5G041100v2 [Setaria italica]|uniref:Uncharacterized protein n=1 Tax=Setaria italica TaxID=4555 RepID=A0A368R160_SETIT|nr:hypothetical protein SETIT_5G041100v2 [Setaria italica]
MLIQSFLPSFLPSFCFFFSPYAKSCTRPNLLTETHWRSYLLRWLRTQGNLHHQNIVNCIALMMGMPRMCLPVLVNANIENYYILPYLYIITYLY